MKKPLFQCNVPCIHAFVVEQCAMCHADPDVLLSGLTMSPSDYCHTLIQGYEAECTIIAFYCLMRKTVLMHACKE
jgi:hypothetical protein